MSEDTINIVFVGERNTQRSIMAEALLRRQGGGVFEVFSAGRNPLSQINAHTFETLKQAGYATENLYPKSWKIFVKPMAPALHVVVTLDEALKRGPFPIWFSNPVYVHWPFVDPETFPQDDMERRAAYRRLYGAMEQQILKLMGLKLKGLNPNDLKTAMDAIAPKF